MGKHLDDPSTGMIGAVVSREEELLVTESSDYGSIDQSKPAEATVTRTQLFFISGSIYLGIFLAAVDTTVVTSIIALIASDLNALGNISWIATAYLLSCSAFQPLWGKLSDIFGRKPLLVLCCAVFAVGCAICSANSLTTLVIGRFVTGLGGSGLTSLGSITFTDIIPLRDRGIYQGLGNIAFGLGAASGGAAGGFIADTLGWRYVFLLQVPLALLVGGCIAVFLRLPEGSPGLGAMHEDFSKKLKRVDFMGSLLLVVALSGILLAASLGGTEVEYGSATFIGLCVVSVGLLILFTKWENDYASEPTMPVHLLTSGPILSTCLTTWLFTMSVFSYLFYIPVYFNSVMEFTATEIGSRIVPNFFAVALGSLGAGFHMKKTGKYYKMMLVIDLISILGVLRITSITPQISKLSQFTLFLPSGFGYAWILTVTLLSLIAAVPSLFQAATTSIQYTFRATGSTLGVSIASAIFLNVLKQNLERRIPALISDGHLAQEIIDKALESTSGMSEFPKLIQLAVKAAYASGCKGALYFSLGTMACGCLTSLFIKEHKLHSTLERDED